MRVVVRTDASKEFGTGHVRRCLTLADRLQAIGGRCEFVCRAFEGHLGHLIEAHGHRFVPLEDTGEPVRNAGYETPIPKHAGWLGAHWQQDVQTTAEFVESDQEVDLLIVDHYALDQRWETALKPQVRCLLALDDLADRQHNCDILVDQSYGRGKRCYDPLVPDDCLVLAGSQYALLRPQFAALRPETLARRAEVPDRKELFVFLGGGDNGPALQHVSRTLCDARPDNLSAVTLVTAGAANGKAIGEALGTTLGGSVEILDQVRDMAPLMSKADLAIGGGGVSGWERCALGLPTLVLTVAENQRPVNLQLARDGHIFDCIDPACLSRELIERFVGMDAKTYRRLSSNASGVTDGRGAERVMDALEQRLR